MASYDLPSSVHGVPAPPVPIDPSAPASLSSPNPPEQIYDCSALMLEYFELASVEHTPTSCIRVMASFCSNATNPTSTSTSSKRKQLASPAEDALDKCRRQQEYIDWGLYMLIPKHDRVRVWTLPSMPCDTVAERESYMDAVDIMVEPYMLSKGSTKQDYQYVVDYLHAMWSPAPATTPSVCPQMAALDINRRVHDAHCGSCSSLSSADTNGVPAHADDASQTGLGSFDENAFYPCSSYQDWVVTPIDDHDGLCGLN